MEPEPSIRQTGEDALVARLLPLMPSNPSLETGPGDDCAIIRGSGNRQLLLKTDCVVEGMHFLPGTAPELIGRKALARAVSDIGAMGGTPLHALVTLFVHADRPISQVEGIYRGMGRLARQFGISIAGGESSGLPADGLIINVALTGEVEEGKAVLRSTARAGDLIAVTGTLGGSFPTGHHLSFMPRVREGGILAASGVATSMMDLSDGLGTDLPRLAAASGLGFRIHEELLPVRPGFTAAQAVGDGEDYELLVTFRPGDRERAARLAAEHFPETPLTVIGEMTAETASALPHTLSAPVTSIHFSLRNKDFHQLFGRHRFRKYLIVLFIYFKRVVRIYDLLCLTVKLRFYALCCFLLRQLGFFFPSQVCRKWRRLTM